MLRRLTIVSAALLAACAPALAQDKDPPQDIAFDGGTFTITQNDDFEKVLTFDGEEIARNYVLYFDREVSLGETRVALFEIGDGGNQCSTSKVIAWKVDGKLQDTTVGEDCGAPPAYVGENQITFLPYLLPGQSEAVQTWSPEEGLRTAGDLSFTPQPATDWSNFDSDSLEYIVSALDNADAYSAAEKLLGDKLFDVVSGLMTGGNAEKQADGTVDGSGCVPHACGVSDSYMAVDPKARKLYFAQQTGDGGQPNAWPPVGEWPKPIRDRMTAAIITPPN